MHRVLLHLLKLVALQDILQEQFVRLVQASHILVEHIVRRLQHLHFAKRQLGVQTCLDIKEPEHILADRFYVQLFNEVLDVVIVQKL